ncbi:sensor histidine kinase [Yinghuangia seranimata]|uniref:sensor histidine kinase n=1 Tax=Yinghuangia seranimata TaxID=408067 RepID=UPI00248A95B5|nr:HAMP domain-containing sensor histidine kinase [Yinghuangia seranimata]MDI2125225.1 HAMP domain-containing sensor histidine kinase [Yinghuangia seranimata]
MRRMPLRARLALLTALAVALAVAAASTACWFLTRDQLMSQMDASLRAVPPGVPGIKFTDDSCQVLPNGRQPQGIDKGFTAQTVQVVLANGTVCPDPFGYQIPASQADIDVANRKLKETIHDATDENGTHMRVITRQSNLHPPEGVPEPGVFPSTQNAAVSVARPLTDIDNSLDNLALLLVLVSGIGVLAAATLGLLVARAALKPVDQLTDVVEHIARTEDLDTTIPVEGKDEIARLGTSFNAMTGALKASRERQQRLIADAGHELRTPLTSLRTNTDLLLRSEEQGRPLPDADKKRLLRNVRGQLRELSGLVGDLLELARPERTRATPVTGVAALHTAVEQAVERAQMRGHETVFDVDLEPWYVRGDEAALERAALNLLDNAVKFGPPDGTIEVRLRQGELTVRDRGPGVDPADAPYVFERFWRSDSARALPGSGLGLAIVARAVAESGGTVDLEPAEGGGTLARVRLPGTATRPGGD